MPFRKTKTIMALSSGILMILISLTVLIGWYTKNESFIRVSPNFAAMVYNTAISIFAVGVALIFLPTRWYWVTRITCMFVIALNFLIICQYLFNVNLYVDELFHKYDLNTPMNFPGRTSLNTSVSLLFGSASIFLITLAKEKVWLFIILIFSALALSLPTSSFFGYITGLESSGLWVRASKTALHTSIACILMGGTALIWTILDSFGSNLQLYALPMAISLSTLIGTLAVWQTFGLRNYLTVRAIAENKAEEVKNMMDVWIREDALALERMAQRWGVLGGYSESLWNVDGKNYVDELLALIELEILDANYQVVASKSDSEQDQAYISYLNIEQLKTYSQTENTFLFRRKFNLLQITIPIQINGQFSGFLVAWLDLDVIFNKIITIIDNPYYKILFLSDNRVIYSYVETNSPSLGTSINKSISPAFFPLDLRLFITKEAVEQDSVNLETFIIINGTILSLLVGATIFLVLRTHKSEQQLKILNMDLQQAKERADAATEAKSTFLATMSHEIRTPLNAVLGTVQILSETELNDTQKKYIHRIDFSSKALLHLINDILDYSRIEAGNLKIENVPFDVMDVTKNVGEGFLIRAEEKNVPLYIEAPEQPIPVFLGDPHRIEQILMNLINNAYKFTEKGSITIKMVYEGQSPQNGTVYFEISDTGIGISEENQKKLFQKFSQVEVSNARKFGGVGLGLSICKGLIKQMKGEIGVRSTENQGSTFWFKIPFIVEKPNEPPAPYNLENTQVLLIDSDERERSILSRYLNAWKSYVHYEYKDELNSLFVAIVSVDQNDLIQKLKEKNISIIYIEGSHTQGAGDDLLTKPVSPKSLWGALQKKRGQ